MKLRQLEKLFFLLTVVGLFIPLATNLYFINLYTWNIPACILIFISITRSFYNYKGIVRRWDLWDISIFGLIFFLLIFTLIEENSEANLPFLMQFVTMILMAFYARRAWRSVITPKMIVLIAVISLLVQSILGFIQQATFTQFGNVSAYFGKGQSSELADRFDSSISRIGGTLGQSNIVANWIVSLFPFAYIASYLSSLKERWFIKQIALIFGVVALFLTISRGSIGIFIILCLIFFMPWYKNILDIKWSFKKILKRFTFFLLVFVMSIFLILNNLERITTYNNILGERIVELLAENDSHGSANFRMEMNKGAIQQFAKQPFIGLGFYNSKNIWSNVDTQVSYWWNVRPHNAYLVLAVEGGIFAFIFYLIFTCLPIYYLIKRFKSHEVLRYAFLFALISGVLFSQMYLTTITPEYGVLYSIILGCSMGYIDEHRIKEVDANKFNF